MIKRNFATPTKEEIEDRKRMYERAEEVGIDLMAFDGDSERKDIRKAVVLIGSGKQIPEELKKRLILRNKKQKIIV